MADNASPLDNAIASVEREDLGGASSAAGDGDAFASPPPAQEPEQRKPGRPRSPNSRRSRAGRYNAGGGAAAPSAAASGPVNDPPVPPVKFAPIDPRAVAQSIQQIDAILVKAFGTQPLSPDEAIGGGQVFAPVLDHYMPMLADKGGLWIAPLTWVILAYGPRAYEVLDARQKAAEARRAGWSSPTPEARTGDNGTGRFPASADSAAQ